MGARTDTRERMVATAAELIRARGISGTSIAKVLERSRGPRGSVGFHFPGGRAELMAEAVRQVGDTVTRHLRAAADADRSAAEIFTAVVDRFRARLLDSDFADGCPVGAAMQEAYDDPTLGPVVADVADDWITTLADALRRDGRDAAVAAELATLCVSSMEGAISLARVRRSLEPIDAVRRWIVPLLV